MLLVACGGEPPVSDAAKASDLVSRADAALARGADAIEAHQQDDGGFHSTTYGAFRDGRAVTPLSLMGLWAAGRGETDAFDRGVAFMVSDDAEPEAYPEYILAISLLVLGTRDGDDVDAARRARAEALIARQGEDGGWGYLGEGSNVSSTVFAVGGLRMARLDSTAEALARARPFVESLQNFAEPSGPYDDGGFFFSRASADGNKAGEAGTDASGPRYRSYGSASSDGVRALIQLGAPVDGARVQAARAWLVERFDPEQNPGEFPEGAEVRRRSNYYYYVWSVAHALRAVGETAWAGPLAKALLARQQEDGSWRNEYTELREDDPLVGTPFALAGLALARMVLAAEPRSHAPD